ncbi:DUF2079 domain-containing protein [uncultured Methanospirillum sp.]|uniref:DUF2079 domain-containing protein n=1 Tax=uncultured Methanospirillum sp. TaxID=262503 RepID=UPI003749DDAA
MKTSSVNVTRFDIIFLLCLGIYILFFSWYSILKMNTFQMNHDLGIFSQALWSTAFEGRFFFNSLENSINNGVTSHFGVHTSPILVVLLPLYAILPGAQTLLVVQTILLGLGAVPIYITAKKYIGESGAVVLSLIYFLYPALHGVTLTDFHEIAFLPLLLGFFAYACIFKRNIAILILGLICLMIKEDVAVIILFASLYGVYLYRNQDQNSFRTYLTLLIVSAIWVIIAFFVIMPAFSPMHELVSTTFISQYYQVSADSNFDLIPRIVYLIEIFIPLLFLPLLSPEILVISIPPFAEIFLSQSGFFNIGAQYSSLLIVPLFFATIFSLQKIQKKVAGNTHHLFEILLLALLVSNIISCCLYSPAVTINPILEASEDMHADSEWFIKGVSQIPGNASVSTQANLVPFFSERMYLYEDQINNADYVVFLTKFVNSKSYVDRVQEISRSYKCIYRENGLYIFKRSSLS